MTEPGPLRGNTLNDLAAEFRPMFEQRAAEIEQERQERAHRLELAQAVKKQRAQETADALGPLLDQLDAAQQQRLNHPEDQ